MAPLTDANEEFSSWVGLTEEATERVDPLRVAALASTLDLAQQPGEGERLPPGWHWIFFNRFARRSDLDADGHPKRGGFLPPVSLSQRMWAGGRLAFQSPVRIGQMATRRSKILVVTTKSGRRGKLVFVTVRHEIFQDGVCCISEEQDIVYREASVVGAVPPKAELAPDVHEFSEPVQPDTPLLFRYSALTANSHRIHYDQAYAIGVEAYPDLVVHGPLIATLLQGFAERCVGRFLSSFVYRGVNPLFVSREFTLAAAHMAEAPHQLSLWARGPDGELAMRATAEFTS